MRRWFLFSIVSRLRLHRNCQTGFLCTRTQLPLQWIVNRVWRKDSGPPKQRKPSIVNRPKRSTQDKPPLRWTGVLFALAANVLLVTLADGLAQRLGGSVNWETLATIAAPVLAGMLTAFYAGSRGAMHAFLGGALSAPILTVWVFSGAWPLAVFAMAFCTLGGAFTELAMRRSQLP